MPFTSLHEFFATFMHPGAVTIFAITMFLIIIIPLIALIYGGLKMLLRFKANDRVIALTGLVLWIVSILFLVTTILFESTDYFAPGQVTTEQTLSPTNSDTLVVTMNPDPDIEGFNNDWYYEEDEDWYVLSDHDRMYSKIDLDIEPSKDENYRVKVVKSSVGSGRPVLPGVTFLQDYNWSQEGDTLLLDPYFSKSKIHPFHLPEAEVVIKVPEGKYIQLDRSTKYFLDDVTGIPDEEVQSLAGKTFLIFP